MDQPSTLKRRRPGVVPAIGLMIAGALLVAGCGGSSGSSSTPSSGTHATSTPPPTSTTTSPPPTTTTGGGALSGKWTGTYTGAYSGTFTLNWTQSSSKLSGTINLSTGGTMPVHGTVAGSAIKFGTVGSTAITYTGTVSGSSMSGTYSTPGGGGPWSAHRS